MLGPRRRQVIVLTAFCALVTYCFLGYHREHLESMVTWYQSLVDPSIIEVHHRAARNFTGPSQPHAEQAATKYESHKWHKSNNNTRTWLPKNSNSNAKNNDHAVSNSTKVGASTSTKSGGWKAKTDNGNSQATGQKVAKVGGAKQSQMGRSTESGGTPATTSQSHRPQQSNSMPNLFTNIQMTDLSSTLTLPINKSSWITALPPLWTRKLKWRTLQLFAVSIIQFIHQI